MDRSHPLISFVIISGGARPAAAERLIASIDAQPVPSRETVIVGRHDGPLPAGVRLVESLDEAAAAAICAMRNRGVDATTGDYVLLLDDDAELTPGWYGAIAPALGRYDVTGCRVVTPAGARWYDWAEASRTDPACPARLLDYDERSPDAYVSGCFMLIRRGVFDAVRFDESRANHQRDDVDFCHRVHDAGLRLGFVPEATVIHHLDPAGRSGSDPASGDHLFAEGVNLYRLERYADAADRLRQAAHLGGGPRVAYHLALVLLGLGREEEAAPLFARVARDADPAGPDRRLVHGSRFRLGQIAERRGDLAAALAHYRAAAEGFPDHREAAAGLRRCRAGEEVR